jgi:hypothetical protein
MRPPLARTVGARALAGVKNSHRASNVHNIRQVGQP